MPCLTYSIRDREYDHLFGSIPWLEEHVGPQRVYYRNLDRNKPEDSATWNAVFGDLQKLVSHLPLDEVDHIAFFSGDGWQFFYAVTRFRLDTQNMRSFVVLNIEDETMAVMFKLRFSQ